MIDHVAGVTIWTDDLERLLSFYRDTLQLTVHRHHGHFVNFDFGNVRLNLGLHDRVRGRAQDPYRIMVHLSVSDIHQEYRRLTDQWVPFIRVPEREEWGGWVATFQDPDGNILQLLQQPEGG